MTDTEHMIVVLVVATVAPGHARALPCTYHPHVLRKYVKLYPINDGRANAGCGYVWGSVVL